MKSNSATRISIQQRSKKTRKSKHDAWQVKKVGKLSLLFSPLLAKHSRLIHAFTTRLGGTSAAPLRSFNLSCTRDVDGSKEDALKNRHKLCKALNLNADNLVVPYQTHSTKVRWLVKQVVSPKTDGLATAKTGIPMLLQFADCVPVILYDTRYNAAAVLHAGWRGTASGIATKGLKTLLKKTGAKPEDVVAAVGPAIGSCCYPTGQEVVEGLFKSVKSLKGLVIYRGKKPHPDLKGVNARQLLEAGVKHVDVCPFCTSCNSKLFYSHRKGETGRQGAIAALTAVVLTIGLFAPVTSFALASTEGTVAAQDLSALQSSALPQKSSNGAKESRTSCKSKVKPRLTPLKPKLTGQEKPISDSPQESNELKDLNPKISKDKGENKSNLEEKSNPKDTASELVQTIDQLERITYGASAIKGTIEERLASLEQSIFHTTFELESTAQRARHLLQTLLGPDATIGVQKPPATEQSSAEPSSMEQPATADTEHDNAYRKELSVEQLYRFALAEINASREDQGMSPLQWDKVALKVAAQHTKDLCSQSGASRFSKSGNNPDLQYTKLGGTDALTESIVTVDCDAYTGNNKATVIRLLQAINNHQDYHDSVFSPDATHFGLAYGTATADNKIIACIETVTRHAVMHSIPMQIQPGQKIEVKGVMMEPYNFKLISLAWEGQSSGQSSSTIKPSGKDEFNEESVDDATLYFPPLDYAAYGQKAQHGEHEKALNILRTTGVIAAIAGGMFIPPVAFAAPLIAMSGSFPSEPHAISEIPVHGGIKVTGNLFYGTIPVSHQNKDGLYYVTVWASTGENHRPVPVSRRVIVAKTDDSIKISTQEKLNTSKELQ